MSVRAPAARCTFPRPGRTRRSRSCLLEPVCSAPRLRVVYSHSKKDVPIDSLACLLEAEYFGTADWSGSHKLARAVNNSSAVVTAFAKTSDLAALGAGSLAPAATSKLSLVGFARASSDAAFAATIHNVIVHPAVRHRGIGRNLLSRLTAQMKRAGVTDIGLLAPEAAWDFFYRVSFDEDRELSLPLRYPRCTGEPQVF